jgi:TolB-like protein
VSSDTWSCRWARFRRPLAANSTRDRRDVFSDGLTEETHLQLGRLQPARLTVIAGTTSRGYAKRAQPIAALIDEIGVDYVLEGSVRRCTKHSRLRVTAHLVRASDRRGIWSDRLQEPLDEAVDMQRTLGRTLAERAATALAQRDPARLAMAVPSSESAEP